MMQKNTLAFLFNCKSAVYGKKRHWLFIDNSRFYSKPLASPMSKKCPSCKLVNFAAAETCARCGFALDGEQIIQPKTPSPASRILRRGAVCVVVILCALVGFYLSLIISAGRLNYDQKKQVERAIGILDEKGFSNEAFLLSYVTAFRAEDNWLNASVTKENAYAATNYPFEIMTVYPDFFTYPVDDTERAAILLHEAKHLQGKDEKEAYEFIWKNRAKLGWSKDKYRDSPVWQNVRKQTREYVPSLFVCDVNEFGDCTE
jgi:hypothetical protein